MPLESLCLSRASIGHDPTIGKEWLSGLFKRGGILQQSLIFLDISRNNLQNIVYSERQAGQEHPSVLRDLFGHFEKLETLHASGNKFDIESAIDVMLTKCEHLYIKDREPRSVWWKSKRIWELQYRSQPFKDDQAWASIVKLVRDKLIHCTCSVINLENMFLPFSVVRAIIESSANLHALHCKHLDLNLQTFHTYRAFHDWQFDTAIFFDQDRSVFGRPDNLHEWKIHLRHCGIEHPT